ncbi:MAG: adenosylmethionine--8-amino-7-oxononanoate transaminase [Methylocystis sp.]
MSVVKNSPVWRPFTQHALQPNVFKVSRARGSTLELEDGRKFIDAISSWWVITHGHCQPEIMQAISKQAETLDQVIFAGFTHEPAEKLAHQLLEFTPAGLEYVFYSDSGSTSVEVAIKMALGFWRNRGEPRSRILALEHGYHGDTIGAMSVGARSSFNAPYEPLLFDVERIPFPYKDLEQNTFDALEQACRLKPAAFIVEPLILGAGGMLIYSSNTLAEMYRICTSYDVLFIADEVMTGFGRTGTMFACEQANITPDIACYSKGITGGAIPLAVTMCRKEIFEAHYAPERARAFFHSSSFMANPLACAAALANLELWRLATTRQLLSETCLAQKSQINRFYNNNRFAGIRYLGTIVAVDLKIKNSSYLSTISLDLMSFFNDLGILLRPLGSTIYVLPPYCISSQELEVIYNAIESAAEKYSKID